MAQSRDGSSLGVWSSAMKRQDKRVDVIIGGVHKAGTTALHTYLCQHSFIAGGARKEIHFFDNEEIDWQKPDYQMLHEFFRLSDPQKLWLDATPIYSFWPPSIERIRLYNRNARLIFIFRDPIERAISHWRMQTGRGAETLPFGEAIRSGRERMRGLPPLAPLRRIYSYVERGFYADQVMRILAAYPREQIYFLSSDQLARDHMTVLNSIAVFLQLPPFPKVASARHFVADAPMPNVLPEDLELLAEMYERDLSELSLLTGVQVDHWLTVARAWRSEGETLGASLTSDCDGPSGLCKVLASSSKKRSPLYSPERMEDVARPCIRSFRGNQWWRWFNRT
jgi:hypothetical protein